MSHEPALRFWLGWAEQEGALVEDAGDHALLVLPEPVQEAAELPEEVAVTSDPDVAREDGAVLLIPGHPALERAAAGVLEAGDAGRTYLPWPDSADPRAGDLEARARERFHVEHGRIDAAGQPRRAYLPLLRVGAMIHYAASLTHRFQEQDEVWVDARTGLALPVGAFEALRSRPQLPEPDARHPVLEAELRLAVPRAHAALEERAAARAAALLAQGRRALQSELNRADAYYSGTLESIERRRATAPPDRARLLDAQAEATRAEQARRRREIEEQHRPRHELRPFRLHLVLAPAFVLPVEIRRGRRAYPFELAWLAFAGSFAEVRCPRCAADAELVAGRERLGCRGCLPRAGAPQGRLAVAEVPSVERAPESARAPGPPARSKPPQAEGRPRPAGRSKPSDRPPPNARRRSAAELRRGRGDGSARLERTGNKLALDIWQSVAHGERWPRKKVARNSPLSALYRLYGPEGPLRALGVPSGAWPAEATTVTYPSSSGAPMLTHGEIKVGRGVYPYSLYWWLEAGKPVLAEVLPMPTPLLLAPNGRSDTGLRDDSPRPLVPLDPVAAELWRVELPATGLPMTVRCLATWWRMEAAADPSQPPAAVAAAIGYAVGRAAGLRRTRVEAADAFGVERPLMDDAARALGSRLRLDRVRGW